MRTPWGPIADWPLMLLVVPKAFWGRFGEAVRGPTALGLVCLHACPFPRVTSIPSGLCLPGQRVTPQCCGFQWRPSLLSSPSTQRAWCGWYR
jgi:hypothetical protein